LPPINFVLGSSLVDNDGEEDFKFLFFILKNKLQIIIHGCNAYTIGVIMFEDFLESS
jgi:hypothetical protein